MTGFHVPGWMLQPDMTMVFQKNYKIQAEKYKNSFGKEEKESHLKAVDEILKYINSQLQ